MRLVTVVPTTANARAPACRGVGLRPRRHDEKVARRLDAPQVFDEPIRLFADPVGVARRAGEAGSVVVKVEVLRISSDQATAPRGFRGCSTLRGPRRLTEEVVLAQTEAVVRERYGRPVAVLISPERYDVLMTALENAEDGPTIPLEQVRARVIA